MVDEKHEPGDYSPLTTKDGKFLNWGKKFFGIWFQKAEAEEKK